ncbi:MAG: outer membrane beta-barrel family protein [Alistipes putredinis]|nr:MAG: outer membrane beta-barrel family protein [Alistipes putredinis]
MNFLNNYEGDQTLLAGYVGINLPAGAFNIYAGARYEYNRQVLRMNTRQFEESLQSTPYDNSDILPSANVTYNLNDRHQLRAAYGRSVNRPEFRELSTSVYYDFELGSSVMGNSDLKPCLHRQFRPAIRMVSVGGRTGIGGFFLQAFQESDRMDLYRGGRHRPHLLFLPTHVERTISE